MESFLALAASQPTLTLKPGGVLIVQGQPGGDLYVLEYTDTPLGTDGSDRTVWVPRVRKVATDGRVSVVAVVRR